MFRAIAIALLFAVLSFGCVAFKPNDVLPKAIDTHSSPNGHQDIGVTVKYADETYSRYYKEECAGLSSSATRVFNRYGWKTVPSDDTQIAVELIFDTGMHMGPLAIFHFASYFTIPAKADLYYFVKARILLNGEEAERYEYVASESKIMSLLPIPALIPGVDQSQVGAEMPAFVKDRLFETTMEHIAEDLRTKYFSGNYQTVAI